MTAIRLFTTSERAPVILDPWVIAGETNAEGALLVDVKQARIGEVQAEGCMVRKPMPPPDADFRGSCQKTESGITLRGELPSSLARGAGALVRPELFESCGAEFDLHPFLLDRDEAVGFVAFHDVDELISESHR